MQHPPANDDPPAAPLVCPVCKTVAPPDALFCPRCTAPLNVISLSDLTDADQRRCFAALGEVLASTVASDASVADDAADAELFAAYLSALWLRPETALIQFAEARALLRLNLPSGPWLDLGCGDGIHAALTAGWRFGGDFDAFQSLDLDARDMFDHFDAGDFRAEILTRGRPVDVGIDIKPTAVERSRALGVFGRVEQADATALPVEDGSISVIFSNMLRDLGRTLHGALDEARRVLRPDGRLVISAMTPAYRKSLYFARKAQAALAVGEREKAEQLLRLDRGRSVFCQQQLATGQWVELLTQHGLELIDVEPVVGPAVIRFWDVGLRPFAVPLITQARAWRERGVLGDIKPPLVSVMNFALSGLRRSITTGDACMHLLVAQPAGRP